MARARKTGASAAAVASATAAPAEGQNSTGATASAAPAETSAPPPASTPPVETVTQTEASTSTGDAAAPAETSAPPPASTPPVETGAQEAAPVAETSTQTQPLTLGRVAERAGSLSVGDGFRLRLTSARAPYTRGGIRFETRRDPVTLDEISLDQFRALIADPAIQMEVENVETGKLVLVPRDVLALEPGSEGFDAFARALAEAEDDA